MHTTDDQVLDTKLLQMLDALASGLNHPEVAVLCDTSERTVRRRLAELRRTWGITNNTQAIVHAVRQGLI